MGKKIETYFVFGFFIIFACFILYVLSEYHINNIETMDTHPTIPIVIISWNNYYFVKHFIDQIKHFNNPIIVLDNNSNYQPLLDYYKDIKLELNEKIDIRLLSENHGHMVYAKLSHELPDIFILSDPDLELNPNMPSNFTDILLSISNKYQRYKVGLALSIEDSNEFIQCDQYSFGKNIHDWESQFWSTRIDDSEYELYNADIDTTFCLINKKYNGGAIRIAGNFTAKHLPWYDNYIKHNVSRDEIDNWLQNNKSSSILFSCLKL